ncbi:MAG: hypothetical protein BEN18_04140 [Epulopiscium sp. Nuni2H_MBin001]|nr:MAG: hypothetical protein BEN18_04140 [Epulopiscium sp. Nuni2H_MBin001]
MLWAEMFKDSVLPNKVVLIYDSTIPAIDKTIVNPVSADMEMESESEIDTVIIAVIAAFLINAAIAYIWIRYRKPPIKKLPKQ